MGTVLLTLSINYKPWAFLCKTLVSCKQDVVQSWWTDCCIVDLRPHQSLDSCRGRGKGQPIRAESCWDDSNRNLWRAPISRRAVLLSLLSDRRSHTHTHTHQLSYHENLCKDTQNILTESKCINISKCFEWYRLMCVQFCGKVHLPNWEVKIHSFCLCWLAVLNVLNFHSEHNKRCMFSHFYFFLFVCVWI